MMLRILNGGTQMQLQKIGGTRGKKFENPWANVYTLAYWYRLAKYIIALYMSWL